MNSLRRILDPPFSEAYRGSRCIETSSGADRSSAGFGRGWPAVAFNKHAGMINSVVRGNAGGNSSSNR
jgi:hypothetical protein